MNRKLKKRKINRYYDRNGIDGEKKLTFNIIISLSIIMSIFVGYSIWFNINSCLIGVNFQGQMHELFDTPFMQIQH